MAAEALEEWAACPGENMNDLQTLGEPNYFREKWGIPKRGAPRPARPLTDPPRPAQAPVPPQEPEVENEVATHTDADDTVELDTSQLDSSCSDDGESFSWSDMKTHEVRNETTPY